MKEKYWLTCIFLCVTFFIKAQGEFIYPDELYAAEKYLDAAIEYERIVISTSDNKIANEAKYRKALAYRDIEKYSKALDALTQISYFGIQDSIHFLYRYQMAFCYYLNEDFSECESQLLQIEAYIKDSSLTKNTYLLRALNYNEMLEWEKAKAFAEKFIKNNSANQQEDIKNIEEIYSKKNLPRLKNKKVAEVLKYIPGFGQIYAGAFGEGFVNLALNTTSIYLGVNQVLKSFYVTGYFVATIPVSKFYFGSRKRTDFLVEKKNYERVRTFNDEVKSILLN